MKKNCSALLQKQYYQLAKQADKATSHYSLTQLMLKTEACQAIIVLGPKIIPLLLKDLVCDNKNPHWRMAIIQILAKQQAGLSEIVIPTEIKGQVFKQAEILLQWGNQNGLLPPSKK